MRVAVIGAGKMGLPLAAVFASHGAEVVACDVNVALVDSINRGSAPFDEPGLAELLFDVVRRGNLRASTDVAGAISQSDVCVVIVPVLLDRAGDADLSTISEIAKTAARSLRPGSMMCFETTLPVGGCRLMGSLVEEGGLRAGEDFDLVFSPERVKSRRVLAHLSANPKIVGGINERSTARGREFYARYLGAPVTVVASLEAAELAKLAGMIYRDVNIALANELARYSQAVGVDFAEIRSAANTDGEAALLEPGIGVGGHCTPVYPHFLLADAMRRGVPADIARTARTVNDQQPALIIDRIGDVAGKLVAILGLAFRPSVKEAAFSPAYALRDELGRRGATVRLCDPLYEEDEIRAHGFEPGGPDGAEIVVLNTAHAAFSGLDFGELADSGTRVIVDGRNLWDPREVGAAGLRYIGVGRPEGPMP